MYASRALRIEILRGGESSVLEVQEEGALIGSGSHCDVRLAPDEAAVEQLYVELVGDEVHARAKSHKPQVRVNGAPFLAGRIAASALIEMGAVSLRASMVGRKDESKNRRESEASTSPAVQGVGLLAVAVGLYAVLKGDAAEDLALSVVQPPHVHEEAQVSCPQRDSKAACALAAQLVSDAASKRERAPFHPGDAAVGAGLYLRAAGCFTRCGDTQASEGAMRAARELEVQVADQVRLAHVRIERSLEASDYERAGRNAELALALVSGRDPNYAEWLRSVMRASTLRAKGRAR